MPHHPVLPKRHSRIASTSALIGWLLVLLSAVGAAHARTTTKVEYIHTDALGPVAVTNEAGQVIERTQWEPYGAAIGKPAYDGPGCTGHVMDGATGLTYMQQRYYDPAIGRFLSVDPVTANSGTGANFNRYWYAHDSPYRFTDPDGRQSYENIILSGQMADDQLREGSITKEQHLNMWDAGAKASAQGALIGLSLTRGLEAAKNLGSLIRHKDSPRIESKARAEPGADGGKSTITREIDRKTGDTLSTRHTVERNGKIVHQHQDHMGKSGSIRTFSDKLTGTNLSAKENKRPPQKTHHPISRASPRKDQDTNGHLHCRIHMELHCHSCHWQWPWKERSLGRHRLLI